jgi:hypothetical protein
MATLLKQVLDRFDDPGKVASLSQIAQDLQIDMPTLQGMIDYWVRKGKLREVVNCESSPVCSCCGPKTCPFVVAMPRGYESVPVISPDDIQ